MLHEPIPLQMRIPDVYNEDMKKAVYKRLNITLPESTVDLLESFAGKGERSVFIDIAIRSYVKRTRQENLRESLKQGAIARSERDLSLTSEWDAVEEESWGEN